ncbi:MAG TPA: hypothetical protein VFX96_00215 [Pyrinomonadaceae bacterium]|nr:hypothetical protein [Pyrinomonadaceae bacterium]
MSESDETSETGGGRVAREESGTHEGSSARGAGEGGALAYEQARLAYSIIQTLLEHTRVTSDLVALMAQVLGEETARAVTETPHWAAYLESRRAMERTRADIERFAEEWTHMTTPDAPTHESNSSPDTTTPAPTDYQTNAPTDAATRESEE